MSAVRTVDRLRGRESGDPAPIEDLPRANRRPRRRRPRSLPAWRVSAAAVVGRLHGSLDAAAGQRLLDDQTLEKGAALRQRAAALTCTARLGGDAPRRRPRRGAATHCAQGDQQACAGPARPPRQLVGVQAWRAGRQAPGRRAGPGTSRPDQTERLGRDGCQGAAARRGSSAARRDPASTPGASARRGGA